MNDRTAYFRQHNRNRKTGRGHYRKRRSEQEARDLWAVLNFYRKCGHTIAKMVELCEGRVRAATANYYLNDRRCKARP